MTPAVFTAALRTNPAIPAIVDRLRGLGVDQPLLTGGCLAQTWWNILGDRDPATNIRDYDLFYWDADTSWEAEDRVIRRAAGIFAPTGLPVEVRNQARVHLWFTSRFGAPCPPLPSAKAGVDRFLFLGIRLALTADWQLYAPAGLDDTLAGMLTPDPAMPRLRQARAKAADYRARFPMVRMAVALEGGR